MPNAPRHWNSDRTRFFTVMLAPDCGVSLIAHLHHLRTAYRDTLRAHPFKTDAIVVLPDHLHAVWTLPAGDTGLLTRWAEIKDRFSAGIGHPAGARDQGAAGLWRPRLWDHGIRSREDLELHCQYCWSDPVRHGLARQAQDWAASSFHREVRAGTIGPDWQPAADNRPPAAPLRPGQVRPAVTA